jgi:hypothetical protein
VPLGVQGRARGSTVKGVGLTGNLAVAAAAAAAAAAAEQQQQQQQAVGQGGARGHCATGGAGQG